MIKSTWERYAAEVFCVRGWKGEWKLKSYWVTQLGIQVNNHKEIFYYGCVCSLNHTRKAIRLCMDELKVCILVTHPKYMGTKLA